MCGIIGIVSEKQVLDRLIDGLERLEYRGYDSSGVAVITREEIFHSKSTGKLNSLKNKLKHKFEVFEGVNSIPDLRIWF